MNVLSETLCLKKLSIFFSPIKIHIRYGVLNDEDLSIGDDLILFEQI